MQIILVFIYIYIFIYTYLRVKKGLALFTLQIHLKSTDPEGVKGVGDAPLLHPLARVGPKIARF